MLISKRKFWTTLLALAVIGIFFASSSPLLGAPVTGGPGFVSVGPHAFKPILQTTSFSYIFGHLINTTNNPASFVAPVNLPHGATITQLVLYYLDNGTSAITVELRSYPLDASSTFIYVAQMTTSEASSLSRNLVVNTFVNGNLIDNQSNFYFVTLQLPSGFDYMLFGFRIDYNYPTNLPLIVK